MFQTTKIQTFESNSQLSCFAPALLDCCFRLQRYKLLKAIHNLRIKTSMRAIVVSDYENTNFWKQFTTPVRLATSFCELFQTTKIQTFESNSQREFEPQKQHRSCFRLRRYKLLKAIHNRVRYAELLRLVVSDYKDTNFWKQFTTRSRRSGGCRVLFQTTKIQIFESNSQLGECSLSGCEGCFRLQKYNFLKAIHNRKAMAYLVNRLFQTTKIQIFESNSQHYVRRS